MNRGLTIDFETADRITILTLLSQVGYLKEELRAHVEEGKWLHPEDKAHSMMLIPAIELIIDYFGGPTRVSEE
jgi:hypothetical protein